MKLLLILLSLTLFISCNEDKNEEATETKPSETMQADAPATGGIAEENNMCICTKDYRPVCGSNGVTYPNPCQAGCDKIKEFTEGPCEDSK
tara:strand:+ start:559 stop:831 length:273 start_codon:yes stop_codon:yes gene_type:complete